jgi:hypothetical protein
MPDKASLRSERVRYSIAKLTARLGTVSGPRAEKIKKTIGELRESLELAHAEARVAALRKRRAGDVSITIPPAELSLEGN